MRKSGRVVLTLALPALMLALSACGATQAVQSFTDAHTRCVGAGYDAPVFSADGSLIYYALYPNVGEDTGDIHVMRSDGSGDQRVEPNARPESLSPDGAMLLFTRPNPDSAPDTDYFVLDLATMESRRVIEVATLAEWSPDSQWIVYVDSDGLIGPIAKTHIATGETVELVGTSGDAKDWATRPIWSPDGSQIAFGPSRDEQQWVTLMRADGSQQVRLALPPDPACGQPYTESDVPLAWLPGGDGLVVSHWCGPSSTLRMITTRGEVISSWGSYPRYVNSLDWSPSARRFLLWTDESIITADFDGSNAATLRQGVTRPSWSPDGAQIVFAGVDQAHYQVIFVMNADGTGLTQLTHNPGSGQICPH